VTTIAKGRKRATFQYKAEEVDVGGDAQRTEEIRGEGESGLGEKVPKLKSRRGVNGNGRGNNGTSSPKREARKSVFEGGVGRKEKGRRGLFLEKGKSTGGKDRNISFKTGKVGLKGWRKKFVSSRPEKKWGWLGREENSCTCANNQP